MCFHAGHDFLLVMLGQGRNFAAQCAGSQKRLDWAASNVAGTCAQGEVDELCDDGQSLQWLSVSNACIRPFASLSVSNRRSNDGERGRCYQAEPLTMIKAIESVEAPLELNSVTLERLLARRLSYGTWWRLVPARIGVTCQLFPHL